MRPWATNSRIRVVLRFQASEELAEAVLGDQARRSWRHIAVEEQVILEVQIRNSMSLSFAELLELIGRAVAFAFVVAVAVDGCIEGQFVVQGLKLTWSLAGLRSSATTLHHRHHHHRSPFTSHNKY